MGPETPLMISPHAPPSFFHPPVFLFRSYLPKDSSSSFLFCGEASSV